MSHFAGRQLNAVQEQILRDFQNQQRPGNQPLGNARQVADGLWEMRLHWAAWPGIPSTAIFNTKIFLTWAQRLYRMYIYYVDGIPLLNSSSTKACYDMIVSEGTVIVACIVAWLLVFILNTWFAMVIYISIWAFSRDMLIQSVPYFHFYWGFYSFGLLGFLLDHWLRPRPEHRALGNGHPLRWRLWPVIPRPDPSRAFMSGLKALSWSFDVSRFIVSYTNPPLVDRKSSIPTDLDYDNGNANANFSITDLIGLPPLTDGGTDPCVRPSEIPLVTALEEWQCKAFYWPRYLIPGYFRSMKIAVSSVPNSQGTLSWEERLFGPILELLVKSLNVYALLYSMWCFYVFFRSTALGRAIARRLSGPLTRLSGPLTRRYASSTRIAARVWTSSIFQFFWRRLVILAVLSAVFIPTFAGLAMLLFRGDVRLWASSSDDWASITSCTATAHHPHGPDSVERFMMWIWTGRYATDIPHMLVLLYLRHEPAITELLRAYGPAAKALMFAVGFMVGLMGGFARDLCRTALYTGIYATVGMLFFLVNFAVTISFFWIVDKLK
ncbi:hypothetical protein B0T17DRAFT_620148 [Bombardia bombarda]|uniref:Uncharacterized protein n=1 Tax=Bombardia bombarda TaxID=252184 RepID=A0AA39WH93_9PEZI|nr:hypothetical protein B0T17DRAFT_620148 [Bombardia bombarda]